MGMTIAEDFSRIKPVNLVFIQKSEFPARDFWNSYQKSRDENDKINKKIALLKSFEERGCRILIIQADVTNIKEMKRALNEVKNQFNNIDGLIHAAGIPDGKLFLNQTKYQLKKVMQPKVNGSKIIFNLLKKECSGFIVFFSALTAITGAVGQLGYCSGNNFVDSFVQSKKDFKLKIFSINWDLWRDIGMSVDLSHSTKTKDFTFGDMGLPASLLVDYFWKFLSCPSSQFIIASESLDQRVNRYKNIADRYLKINISPSQSSEVTFLGKTTEKPIMAKMIDLFSLYLEVSSHSFDADSDFFSMGGDSLLAIQFAIAVEKASGVKLYPHEILLYSTPRKLTQYISNKCNHRSLDKKSLSLRSSSLVCLNQGKNQNSLYLIHPVGGTFYIYNDLIKHLPKDLTIYGIQAQDLEKRDKPLDSIQEMASHYISLIQDVQPDAPYCLAGFSFGGIVAYEMARQLSTSNYKVDYVIMIDSPHYESQPRAFEDNAEIISYLLKLGSNCVILHKNCVD